MEERYKLFLSSMSVHHIDVVVNGGISNEEWRFTGFLWLAGGSK